MQVRGRIILTILFTFLLFAYNASGIIPHENFEEADEDLYAIVSFFDDTLILCKETLEYSYLGNITINFEGIVDSFYSQEDLKTSQEKSDEIVEKLSYSSDIIDKIKNKASSYLYLKDFVLILKNIGLDISDFSNIHQKIIRNFTIILNYLQGFGNESEVVSSFVSIRSLISKSNNIFKNVETNLESLNESFYTENIRNLIQRLSELLDRYDSYVETLIFMVKIDEPILFLYVDKNHLYLGEELLAYGYFIARNSFISNQNIRLFKNNTLINETFTDNSGRYECIVPISIDSQPGFFNLSASTFYNNSERSSNNITVFISKIPTSISLKINKTSYYLNESIYFSGKLTDYKKIGIESELFLHFGGYNITINSNDGGNFSYVFNEDLVFGSYYSYVSFISQEIYKSAQSKKLEIKINTPTLLLIYSSENELFAGDESLINGSLKSGINNDPVSNKTIGIYLNNKKVADVKTNISGYYDFLLKTNNFKKGTYSIYSSFISNEAEWRSSSSEIINIKILATESGSDGFLIYLLVFIIILFVVLLFILFRKKILALFNKKSIPASKDIKPIEIVSDIDVSKKPKIDISDFTIDLSKRQTDGFKNAVIKKYQSLLSFLSTYNFNVNKGVTHLDIRKQMLKFGFSRKATNVVTKAFEYAKFSPYILDKKDVALFNKSITSIIENLGAV